MRKSTLEANVAKTKADTTEALQTIWDNVNKGQKKQIRKIEKCQAILERYGVVD